MSDHNPQSPSFNALSTDLIESIFSLLPIPSLVRSSAVCKLWRSIITSLPPPSPSSLPSSFPPSSSRSPWLFLFGIHNTSSFHNQSFAFDPLSDTWLRLPAASCCPTPSSLHLVGSDKFLFTTAPRFSFSPILKSRWQFTSPVRFPRISPLVGVFSGRSGSSKFIMVGGVRFIGGLVDIEDRLAVEVYDPVLDSWDLCPPLPADFRTGNSYQTLSSALFKRRFYVFGIYSCFISSFCLDTYTWRDVQTLRPPGVLFSFLVSCNNMLVLAGMCHSPHGFSFNLWKIDEESMEFSEIAIMPEGLLSGLVDDENEDSTKFASLKCVGLGNLIYVFNEEYHKKYPACICELDGAEGRCRWRRVPQLSSPVNKFHKLVSFCSSVSITDVFQPDEPQQIGSTL